MEATPVNMKSSPDISGSTSHAVANSAVFSAQDLHSGPDSLFAGMLRQKISGTTSVDPVSDDASHSGGVNLPPASMIKTIPHGSGKSESTGRKIKRTSDRHGQSSTCNIQSSEENAGAAQSESIGHSPEMEKLNDGEPLTLIESRQAVPLPRHEEDLLTGAGTAGNETPSLGENGESTRDSKAAIHRLGEIAGQNLTGPAVGEINVHVSLSQTENVICQAAFPQETDATLFARAVKAQEKSGLENKMDEAPTGTSIPEEAGITLNLKTRGADHQYIQETSFALQRNETLTLKNGMQFADGASSSICQTIPVDDDQLKTRESARAASQKRTSAASDGDATIGQETAELIKPGGSPEQTHCNGDAAAETPGQAQDHQQNQSTISNSPMGLSEHDSLPFRMEMSTISSCQEAPTPIPLFAEGIEMQDVIDQIISVRQGTHNDSGRIRIMLNPPHLGAVDLDIVVRGERVEIVMTAENKIVQQALQSRADEICVALQRQDLKIEGFQVLLQDGGIGQQQTSGGTMYRQNHEDRKRFSTEEDAPSSLPGLMSTAGSKSAASLVSIFA